MPKSPVWEPGSPPALIAATSDAVPPCSQPPVQLWLRRTSAAQGCWLDRSLNGEDDRASAASTLSSAGFAQVG
jgi:hypothetical protein